ncbi:hypothetical protein D3C76_128080 [compost metagenome]
MKSMSWAEFLAEQEKNVSGAVCTGCGKLLDDNDVELLSGLCAKCITKESDEMPEFEGMSAKYTGIMKTEEVDKYFSNSQKFELVGMFETIDAGRKADGKKPASDNKYIVINTDEPYAQEIVEVLKRHGHWG